MIRTASGARADTDRGFGLFARRQLVRGPGEVVSVQGACPSFLGHGVMEFWVPWHCCRERSRRGAPTKRTSLEEAGWDSRMEKCWGEGPGTSAAALPRPQTGGTQAGPCGGFSQVGPCPLPIHGVHCQLGGRIGAGRERGPGAVVLPLPVLGGDEQCLPPAPAPQTAQLGPRLN